MAGKKKNSRRRVADEEKAAAAEAVTAAVDELQLINGKAHASDDDARQSALSHTCQSRRSNSRELNR